MEVKFAVCVSVQNIKEEIFASLSDLGFEGVEVFMNRLSYQDRVDAVANLGRLSRDYGIAVSDIEGEANLLNLGLEKDVEKVIEVCRKDMELVHRLDSSILLLPAYRFPKETTREKVFEKTKSSLRQLDKTAKDLGIYLTFEPMNHYETNLLTTAAETARYIDEIGAERVKTIADVYHFNMEETSITDGLRLISKYLVHIHTAENHGGVPGTGSIDHPAIFRTLKSLEFVGYMSLEFHRRSDNWLEDCRKALTYLKALRLANFGK